jgi:hypothetical protein
MYEREVNDKKFMLCKQCEAALKNGHKEDQFKALA